MVKVVTSINVVVGIVMWYLSTVKNIVVLVVTVKTQDGVILSEQGSWEPGITGGIVKDYMLIVYGNSDVVHYQNDVEAFCIKEDFISVLSAVIAGR